MTVEQQHLARQLWLVIEPIHALTYFGNRTQQAAEALGLRGFWMSYFACRAAPMGSVSAATVSATFFNFNPQRVARAIPDAWSYASPEHLISARFEAVNRTATDVFGSDPEVSTDLLELISAAAQSADFDGRPLAAANAVIDVSRESPFIQLWQATTVLRESRGDGHIAALIDADLTGAEALALFSACGGPPLALFEASRGWSHEELVQAQQHLADRRLMTTSGIPTDDGLSLHNHIEAATDRLARAPIDALGPQQVARLIELTDALTRKITESRLIPYPNPIGLPRN